MSSDIPIQNWNALVTAVVQGLKGLQNPPPIKYRYTYENKNVQLQPGAPTRVLALPDGNEYEILIRNLAATEVSLYISNDSVLTDDDSDGEANLSTNNSGLYIKPLGGKVLCRSGSLLLYAVAPTEAEIAITVHSNNKNLSRGEEQQMIPLNIDLLFGTTASNRKFFTGLTQYRYMWCKNFSFSRSCHYNQCRCVSPALIT